MKRQSVTLLAGLLAALIGGTVFAQENNSWVFQDIIPGGHRGTVNAIQYDGDRILSAGEDGFLEIWDLGRRQAVSRFQLSGLPLLSMVIRPGKTQIACIESDNLGQYRISAWDYQTLENLFTLRLRDPVRYLSYSAGGNFLIIARSGSTGIVLVDPETGELLLESRNISQDFPSSVSFAAIGRTERTLLVYSPTGSLSYWELQAGGELRLVPALDSNGRPLNFTVPADLESPTLFGNNLFFAGFGSMGLVILRADTGQEIARDSGFRPGKMAAGGEDLYVLTGAGVQRLRATTRLEKRELRPVNAAVTALAMIPPIGSQAASPVLGTAAGELLAPSNLRSAQSALTPLETKKQVQIVEAAAGKNSIAFITGDKRLGSIPLDFFELRNSNVVSLENSGEYTRITPAGSHSPGETGGLLSIDDFILWQTALPLPQPQLRSPGEAVSTSVATALPGRFPLRSAAVLEDRFLFLDMGGNISVVSRENNQGLFSETVTGAADAAFVDRDNIILGRNALAGSGGASPFLVINTQTSETVPIPYPASLGMQVYRGASGSVYGATVESRAGSLQTSIIRIDIHDPDETSPLVEYQGEDGRFNIAEADGFMASNLGDGAAIYSPRGMIDLDRSPGLPLQIADGDFYFIVLDAEGCISWHDPRTGDILAIFRLYENEWILNTAWTAPVWGKVTQDL
jgi:hypothetical protein